MLKHYLHRSGQIPTSVHPFVKQELLRQPNPLPQSHLAPIMRLVRNFRRFGLNLLNVFKNLFHGKNVER